MKPEEKEKTTNPIPSDEFARLYYQHQYDRMGKQEDQRLTLTNIVISISVVAFTFGFSNISNINPINGIGLPILIVLSNIFAIVYTKRTATFMHFHRERAIQILKLYAPTLFELNEKIHWEKAGWFNGRTNLQVFIHLLIIATALIPFGVFIFDVLN